MGLMDKLADEATKTGGKVYVNPYTGSSIKYNSSKITDIVPTVSKKRRKLPLLQIIIQRHLLL